MGVVRCSRCDGFIDLDYNAEDYIHKKECCVNCLTEKELDAWEWGKSEGKP